MTFFVPAALIAIYLFQITLFARIVISVLMNISREWRPKGVVLLLVEGVLTVTDPPLKALRKIIPPLSIGAVRLDLAIIVLFVLLSFLGAVIAQLA